MSKVKHNYRSARVLRKQMSLPEGLLWRELRARKTGLKFRRQHPIGPYVIDFYCAAAKLGFEIDGIAHGMGANPQRDEKRDAWIADRGLKIVRIEASEVLADPASVAETMAKLAGPGS